MYIEIFSLLTWYYRDWLKTNFSFLDKIVNRVSMDTLFTNERNESDDYYVILGCDELSNVSVELPVSSFCLWLSF
jgi:hypothetical protein